MLLQLKIQIKGITKPPVWRKVLVPADFTFAQLHFVIQAAFGWGGYHMYSFSPNGSGSHPIIEEPYEASGELDSREIKISEAFKQKGDKYVYTYDFGDNWEHIITMEDALDRQDKKPTLLAGKGKTPPEDCGGVPGYQDLLQTINDPQDPDYKSMREWLGLEKGESWDPSDSDLLIRKLMVEQI